MPPRISHVPTLLTGQTHEEPLRLLSAPPKVARSKTLCTSIVLERVEDT